MFSTPLRSRSESYSSTTSSASASKAFVILKPSTYIQKRTQPQSLAQGPVVPTPVHPVIQSIRYGRRTTSLLPTMSMPTPSPPMAMPDLLHPLHSHRLRHPPLTLTDQVNHLPPLTDPLPLHVEKQHETWNS
ncbi:hypothetical protein D9758_009292 [Tetrapyrgos nigripes]|uniref:Uncharacterized protein n=1 Tax=Tetrapyrgos nigripes TaxID=182062 RepID=A0A8H5GGX9_9AGAR|nr:hypothetical protein D9758_009292 [Tetrapyrgos nigripes]